MGGYIELEALEQNLRTIPLDVLKGYFPDGIIKCGEFICRNASRGDKKAGSFKINLRTFKWSDFATSDYGVGLVGFISCGLGLEFKAGLDRIYCDYGGGEIQIKGCGRKIASVDDFAGALPIEETDYRKAPSYEKAMRCWEGKEWVCNNPADTYLTHRAIERITDRDIMRYGELYNVEYERRIGALILPVRALDGKLQAVQRIWLNPDDPADYKGVKGTRKMSLGQIKGGAFKLGAGRDFITVVEGAEDALALYQYGGFFDDYFEPSVWAVLGRSGFLNCNYPRGAHIRIMLDRDKVQDLKSYGKFLKSVKDRMYHRKQKGFGEYSIVLPPEGSKDYNEFVIKQINKNKMINLAKIW